MGFRPRARREYIRTGRSGPAATRRTHCSGTPPATGPRPPSGTAELQLDEGSRAAKPRTQAQPGLGSVADNSGLPDDTGESDLYEKGPLRIKNAAAPNGAAANSSAAIRPDALQSLAGVSGGLCFAPKLPKMNFFVSGSSCVPVRVPTVQLPAISRSFASARGP